MLIRTIQTAEIDHYHLGYIRPDGTGVTSLSEDHRHEITPQVDPASGQIVYVIQPINDHAHAHEAFEVTAPDYDSFIEEEEIKRAKNMFLQARAIEELAGNLEDAEESEEIYCGNQWRDVDRKLLESEFRTVLTLNEIKPKCDILTGHYSRKMTDIKLLPEEKGDQTVADILNFAMKNITNKNKWPGKEKRIKAEAIRVGRGICAVHLGMSPNGEMETQIEYRSWDQGFFGQHTEPDGSDCEYAGLFTDVSEDELQRLYPDKADEISENTFLYDLRKDSVPLSGVTSLAEKSNNFFDQTTKKYRLVELHYRKNRTSKAVLNIKHHFYFTTDGIRPAELKQLKTIKELNFIEYLAYDVYILTFADDVLLKREKSLIPEIGVIPWYCNKVGDRWWGKVYDGKDSQFEINKTRSTIVDILRNTSLNGIGYSASAFENTKDMQNFERDRKRPGFSAKFADGFKEHIHQFEGIRFPKEHETMTQASMASLYSTMGVNPQMQGISDQSQESGSAMLFKKEQGLLGNEFIGDNFEESKKRLGKLLVHCIQAIETPDSLLRLIENQEGKQSKNAPPFSLYPKLTPEQALQFGMQNQLLPPEIIQELQQIQQQTGQMPPEVAVIVGQMQMAYNTQRRKQLWDMLDNMEILDYDITVSESPWSPNYQAASAVALESVFRGDPNKPAHLIIQESPWVSQSSKDKITKWMEDQQQAQAQLEQKKIDSEVQKTMIAAQSKAQQAGTPS